MDSSSDGLQTGSRNLSGLGGGDEGGSVFTTSVSAGELGVCLLEGGSKGSGEGGGEEPGEVSFSVQQEEPGVVEVGSEGS